MSKRKLLLADDSITIQKVVNLTFADEGIEVIAVGDGDSAMRKFDEFLPDLVMADVNMPGINGYEMCRLIKRTEETAHIPVILLVGSFEPFDEAEAQEVGADDFLTKPFQSIRQLVNKVTDLLNRKVNVIAEPPVAETGAPPAVDSFADTLEFENRGDATTDFGDAGMDDEMIETSAANDFSADAGAVYQRETTIDYAKTQPLSADDLRGLSSTAETETTSETSDEVAAANDETPSEQAFTADEPIEDASSAFQYSEAPSFEEEARKLRVYDDEEGSENLSQYSAYRETADEERRDNISETEPQTDYYLETEPQFDKEITDAETLAPEVSYEPEPPREADFSQAETDTEDSSDEEEAAPAEETPASETDFTDEAPPAADTEEETKTVSDEVETTAPASWQSEPTVDYSLESPVETEIEEARTEEMPAAEAASEETARFDDQTEETPRFFAPEDESPAAEIEEPQEETQSEETQPPELISETPMATSAVIPPMDFDDGDLLDLPPLVEETGIRPQPKPQPIVPQVVAPQQMTAEPESKITVTKTFAESEIALSFPPELIEAIAQKVADKISANTMNEVLPQLADLVVQKLAERESKK